MEGDSGRDKALSCRKLVPNHVGKHPIRSSDVPPICVTESKGDQLELGCVEVAFAVPPVISTSAMEVTGREEK